jgi:uncharacterized membrane protein
MKSLLEWYLGIPPAQPGQGTQWTWLHQTPWPAWMPQWFVLVLAIAAVVYIALVYQRDANSASVPWRMGLTVLRLSVIVTLLLILTELTLVVDRTGLPFIAVLVDDSASMSHDDQYSNAPDRAAAKQYQQASGTGRNSRLSIAQGMLARNNGEFLKQLQQRHQVRVYRFSDSASSLGGLETESESGMDALLQAIRELVPTGTDTRPGPAVRRVLNDFRGSLPSAIVILSDGVTTSGNSDKLSTVAQFAARRLVPLYTVGIGSEEAMNDLNLYDTLVDEVAFVDDPITFTSKLKCFGFKGRSVTLTLTDRESRRKLATKKITAAGNGQTQPLEITWIPEEPGDYEFELQVTPQPSESDRSNNMERRAVSVREGHIRVLLIDSEPRWEFRELKTLLEREKTVELHTVLQDADLNYSDQDASAQPLRGRFPVSRDQLFAYDVVIFGDVNPKFLGQSTLENLREFVSEAGGGLIMIAGWQFNPLAYAGSPLETLLPIELDGVKVPPPDVDISQSFQPKLTLEGRKSTPIFRFDEDDRNSQIVWKRLPGLYWLVECPTLRAGATVFAEHPSRMGTDRHLPVIVMQRYGAGKTIFHASDETWLWRRRTGDLYFGRYWIQAIRYLSRSRLLGQSKTARLETDRQVYQRGETVTLRLRFFNEEEVPVGEDAVKVVIERRGAGTQEIVLKQVPQAPNAFEGLLRRSNEGSYHAWVARPDFENSPPSADFRVEAPDREFRVRSLDRREMADSAEITHGRFYTLSEAARLPDEIPRGRPVPIRSEEPIRIWNRWELLLLFTFLLASEWLLRKRLRLV